MERTQETRQNAKQFFACTTAQTSKAKGMIMGRWEHDMQPWRYHDESGERFRQLFRDAEEKRREEKAAVKQVIFWGTVIFVCCALVMAKMYTMGAVTGIK